MVGGRGARDGRHDAVAHLERAGADAIAVAGAGGDGGVRVGGRGGRGDAGEGAAAAAVRPLHDVVGHRRHVGPGELHLLGDGRGAERRARRRAGVERLGGGGDERDGRLLGRPRVVLIEHQGRAADRIELGDGVAAGRGLELIEARAEVVVGQVLVEIDRGHPDVPERAVVGLAHLGRVAHDLGGIDDAAVVGVGLDEGIAEGDARGAARGAPVVEVHQTVLVAVEGGLIHVEHAPHGRRRVHAGVGRRAAQPDLLAADEEELHREPPGVVLEETHRLEQRRAARDRVVRALRAVGVVGGALGDGVVVDEEDDLLALRVVDLGGQREDEVLPGLRALPGGAARIRRGVALARRVRRREAPARCLVLQVLAGERIAERVAGVVEREHVVRGAGADAAVGAEAGDGHVAVAGEVADVLEPARLAGGVDDLLHQRDGSQPRSRHEVGGVDADRRQRHPRHAVEQAVEFPPRQVHLRARGDEIEHRPAVDLEADDAGEDGRGEVAVVAQDVDPLAAVGGAPRRLDAARAQRRELGIGRPGDDDSFLAAPDGNGRSVEDRLHAAREESDPAHRGRRPARQAGRRLAGPPRAPRDTAAQRHRHRLVTLP